jgi:hypothetical protein
MHTYTHTYIHINAHTHTHTHSLTRIHTHTHTEWVAETAVPHGSIILDLVTRAIERHDSLGNKRRVASLKMVLSLLVALLLLY